MLLTLNDDCLYLICEYLNIVDHVELWHTCVHLQNIIDDFYQRKQNVTFGGELWSLGEERVRSFSIAFQNSFYNNVKEISVTGIEIGTFHLLKQLPLCKVTALEVWSTKRTPVNAAAFHKYIKRLAFQLKTLRLGYSAIYEAEKYTFPNVESLYMYGSSDIFIFKAYQFPKLKKLHLEDLSFTFATWSFKNLTELEIRYSVLEGEELNLILRRLPLKKLALVYFDKLPVQFNCQTLEELVIYGRFSNELFTELTKLKALRKIKIKIYSMEKLVCIPQHPSLVCRILTLRIFHELPLKDQNLAKKLKNIEHLTLNVDYDDLEKSFEEVDCCGALDILKSCTNLRKFSISSSSAIAAHILERALDIFQNLFENHQEPVLVNCHLDGSKQTPKFPELKVEDAEVKKIKELALNSFMKVLFKERDYKIVHSGIECDWLASKE